VTGSAHCQLVPYWSRRLGKKTLLARQLSARGGTLSCEDAGGRVMLGGRTIPFLEGTITL
jgi:predicted PhzF superfamily epimerase YddE/YHI9